MPFSLMPLLLLAAGGSSPPCSVADRPTVSDPRALPAWARRQLPPMAPRNGAFNASDMLSPNDPPHQRLVCAYRRATDWIVEYEQGGIALFRKRVVLRPGGKPVSGLESVVTVPRPGSYPPCSAKVRDYCTQPAG